MNRVSANMTASSTETPRRFAGLDRLYGAGACARLTQAHVCVVGVGGVGSWAVEALARSGVGRLTLIDADHVVASNVNRQVQALTDTLGKAKITALRERIAQINPDCVVDEIDDFIDADNCALLPPSADVVLDCTDQVRAKFAMLCHCRTRGQAILLCGAAGGKTDASRIAQVDLAHSVQDPLLAKIRQRWRKLHSTRARATHGKVKKLNIPVLFSDEPIHYPKLNADTCAVDDAPVDSGAQGIRGLNCAGFGSSVMVTAGFGIAAAQWAIATILYKN